MSLYQVQEVTPTAEEIISGKPNAETIGAAVSIFQRDGIVILKQVVHSDALSRLNEVLLRDTERLCADPTTHFNQDRKARNISQGPPTDPELMFDTVWVNPFTAAVSAAILGPRPCLHYVGGNAVLQTTERQTVHADLDEKHLRFPFAVVANIYLVDTGPENGSTEIWVGSHRDTAMDDHVNSPNLPGGLSSIKPELVEKRRAFAPPVQPRIQKGDLVLRDVRLWHAGMPNRSETPRIMLAFSIFPWWYQPDLKLSLPESARPLVERWEKESELQFAVRWRLDGDPVPKFYATCRSTNAALVY